MRLLDNCPNALTAWDPWALPPSGTACCRAAILGAEEPLCRTIGREDEVYRFVWDSSFDGRAMVRIGRSGDVVTLRWRYTLLFRAAAQDDALPEVTLSSDDWARFRSALVAANFQALAPADDALVLDGAEWRIEGRSGNLYRGVSRRSPESMVHELGRLFFALAGAPLSKTRLY